VTAETIKNCWRNSGLLPEAVLNPATTVAPQAQESAETAELDAASADDAEVAAADQESAPDSAMQQLVDAIAQLQALAVRRNLLPEGRELASAEEYVELEGEGEVFEEFADENIVALVQSQGVDEPDSERTSKMNLRSARSPCSKQWHVQSSSRALHSATRRCFVQSTWWLWATSGVTCIRSGCQGCSSRHWQACGQVVKCVNRQRVHFRCSV
jgi:hypothetical protein